MDKDCFEHPTREISRLYSRRGLVGALGLAALAVSGGAEGKRKKRKKKKIKRNDFGCVNVRGFCKNSKQCCSGICEGTKDKKTCRAHNASTCQPGQDICLVGPAPCLTDTGDAGLCGRTTGGAGYCEASADCFACQNDADCVSFCGPGAACLACPGCAMAGLATACAGQSIDSCIFPP